MRVVNDSEADESDVPTDRCPLCGEPNACAVAQGRAACWCFETEIPAEVLARIPERAQGVACICVRCATQPPDPASVIHKLTRNR